jgi:Tfp pilus assembly protein PilF
MKRAFTATALSILLFMIIVFGCRSSGGGDTSKAETQKQFGVRMAKMNLWREAMFRFNRAVEINPNDAMAHNNLAVAYEANGDFDNAAKEYKEALRLDRSNSYIQKNYSRLVEFTTRSKKKQQKPDAEQTTTRPPLNAPQPPVIPPLLPPPTDTSVTTPEPVPPPGGLE